MNKCTHEGSSTDDLTCSFKSCLWDCGEEWDNRGRFNQSTQVIDLPKL